MDVNHPPTSGQTGQGGQHFGHQSPRDLLPGQQYNNNSNNMDNRDQRGGGVNNRDSWDYRNRDRHGRDGDRRDGDRGEIYYLIKVPCFS